jgi:integrase
MSTPTRRARNPFGKIRQLPSGRFQASYVGPDGARHLAPDTFDTRKDADEWLASVRTDISRKEWHRPATRRTAPTLGDYFPGWLMTRVSSRGEPLKPRTREEYAHLFRDHIAPTFGAARLDAITVEMVEAWWADIYPRLGATRRAHAYQLLRTLLRSAVRHGHIDRCPCSIPGAGKVHREDVVRVIEPWQIDALAAAMPDEYAAAVMLAGWLALRSGEIAALCRDDVDLAAGVLHIRRGVTWTADGVHVGTPKSRAGVRDLLIVGPMLGVLKRHLAEHVGPSGDALLFTSRSGGHLRPSGTLHHAFHKARAEIGRPDFKFHHLRHSALTMYAQTGATMKEWMRWGGHSTATTSFIYQHATDERDAMLAHKMAERMTSNVVPIRPDVAVGSAS